MDVKIQHQETATEKVTDEPVVPEMDHTVIDRKGYNGISMPVK